MATSVPLPTSSLEEAGLCFSTQSWLPGSPAGAELEAAAHAQQFQGWGLPALHERPVHVTSLCFYTPAFLHPLRGLQWRLSHMQNVGGLLQWPQPQSHEHATDLAASSGRGLVPTSLCCPTHCHLSDQACAHLDCCIACAAYPGQSLVGAIVM